MTNVGSHDVSLHLFQEPGPAPQWPSPHSPSPSLPAPTTATTCPYQQLPLLPLSCFHSSTCLRSFQRSLAPRPFFLPGSSTSSPWITFWLAASSSSGTSVSVRENPKLFLVRAQFSTFSSTFRHFSRWYISGQHYPLGAMPCTWSSFSWFYERCFARLLSSNSKPIHNSCQIQPHASIGPIILLPFNLDFITLFRRLKLSVVNHTFIPLFSVISSFMISRYLFPSWSMHFTTSPFENEIPSKSFNFPRCFRLPNSRSHANISTNQIQIV